MIYPRNKLNDAIGNIIKNAESSIEEIVKLEEYFKKYERSDFEKERLKQLVELKKTLQDITEIRYYKTPNN